MLDEVAHRLDTFDEANAVRVVLADGQAWAFRKPSLSLRPSLHDGKAVQVGRFISYSHDCDQLIEALASGKVGQFSGVASLAAVVLRKQYDLSEDELDQLLAFRSGDATSTMWAVRVMQIATGVFGAVTRPASE